MGDLNEEKSKQINEYASYWHRDFAREIAEIVIELIQHVSEQPKYLSVPL